ncbi:hypothetical protein C8T65DRAFT_834327 [Cerioporus squamosus]|nr:hypothetical protein C8T65DRAFT_834327 [Cerioporus squamosus]
MSDVPGSLSLCKLCGTAKPAASCSVRMCAKCCVTNGTKHCAYDYHRRKLAQTVKPPTSISQSAPSTADTHHAPETTAPCTSIPSSSPSTSQSTTPSVAGSATSSSQSARKASTFAAPLSSLWTPNQAIGALLAHKQDEARRIDASASQMQALHALANQRKTVLFHVWTQAGHAAVRRSVLVKSHPVYCLEQLSSVATLFPEGTTLCQVYDGGSASWDDVEVSAGRTLREEEREVCLRACGLRDDQCPGLSAVLLSLSPPSSSTTTTTTVFQTPKRLRSSSASMPLVDVSVDSPTKLTAFDVPSLKTGPHCRSRTSSHSHTVSVGIDDEQAGERMSKKPRREPPSASFPSQYPFSTVYDFMGIVEQSGLYIQDALLNAEQAMAIKCSKTTYGEIKKLLRKGDQLLWDDYRGREGMDACWTVYKREVALRRSNNAELPWHKKGPTLTSSVLGLSNSESQHCLSMVSDFLSQSTKAPSYATGNPSSTAFVSQPLSDEPLMPPFPSEQVQPPSFPFPLPSDNTPGTQFVGDPTMTVLGQSPSEPSQTLLPDNFNRPNPPLVGLDVDFFLAGSLDTSDFGSCTPASSDKQSLLHYLLSDSIIGHMQLMSESSPSASLPDAESLPVQESSDTVDFDGLLYIPSTMPNDTSDFPWSAVHSHGSTTTLTPFTSNPDSEPSLPSTPTTMQDSVTESRDSTAVSGLISRYGSWSLSGAFTVPAITTTLPVSKESSLAFALDPSSSIQRQ